MQPNSLHRLLRLHRCNLIHYYDFIDNNINLGFFSILNTKQHCVGVRVAALWSLYENENRIQLAPVASSSRVGSAGWWLLSHLPAV